MQNQFLVLPCSLNLVERQEDLRDVPDVVLAVPVGGEDGEVEEDGVEEDGQQQEGGQQAEAQPRRHQVRGHHPSHLRCSASPQNEEQGFT